MTLFAWADSKIQKFQWYDIGYIKLAVAGFILMIAKLWPPLLSLDWYWYLVIGVVGLIRPYYIMFTK